MTIIDTPFTMSIVAGLTSGWAILYLDKYFIKTLEEYFFQFVSNGRKVSRIIISMLTSIFAFILIITLFLIGIYLVSLF
jgi:hypothetical protein